MSYQTVTSQVPTERVTCTLGEEPEVIRILLEEYRQMRSEIRSRVASQMQGVAFIGLIASVISSAKHDARITGGVAFLALLVAWLWWSSNNKTISHIGRNLAEVERCVNHLAQRKYEAEKPLKWERWSQWLHASEKRRTRVFGRSFGYPDPPNSTWARQLLCNKKKRMGASDAMNEAWYDWVKETEGT